MRRQVLVAVVLAAMLVSAGCVSQVLPGGVGDGERSMAFYISDQQNAIDRFEQLHVTVSEVAVHRKDDPNTNADESGWTRQSVDDVTVDLTQLTGAKAVKLADLTVAYGSYDKVSLTVSNVEGTLKNGKQATVKLPSETLTINGEFSVGESVGGSYVFDVGVQQAGGSGQFVIKPVVGASGADVAVRENPAAQKGVSGSPEPTTTGTDEAVPTTTATEGPATATSTPATTSTETPAATATSTPDATATATPEAGDKVTISVLGEIAPGEAILVTVKRGDTPVPNFRVVVNGERAGLTDSDGERVVTVPEGAEKLVIEVSRGDESAKRTFEVEDGGETATPAATATPAGTATNSTATDA
jgi:hypothetical protein